MSLATSKGQGLKEIEKSAASWNDVSYFDDLLDETITDFTLVGDDKSLKRLSEGAHTTFSPYILRRLYTILALEGHRNSMITPPAMKLTSSESNSEGGTQGSLNASFANLYYEFLLSSLEGRPPLSLIASEAADIASEGADAAGGAERKKTEHGKARASAGDSFDALALGFMDYGLYRRGYKSVVNNLDLISRQAKKEAAERLESMGYFPEGMRIMNVYLAERQGSPDEWRLAFPLAYRDRITELAEEAEIPTHLLFALVREESYFDPSTGSRAGAMGLMQLMPETAEEEAGELGLDTYDLKDPEDNLRIGVKYFKKLYRKLGSWVRALMAYNAGPTKVRRWIRQHRSMPDALRVESFPFPETRHFVRKVLVSTTLYTLLYSEAGGPEDVVELFYPGLLILEKD
jgi:soluble lytic murein transglycosylase-like protein